MSGWTTPADIAAQVERLWARGRMLSAIVSGEALYPLRLRLARPDRASLAARFDEARAWIKALEGASKVGRGHGYEIVWEEINHRQLGRNHIPCAVIVPSEDDALRLIGRWKDADRVRALVTETKDRQPALTRWIAQRPLKALGHAEDWPRLLAVVAWLRDNPRSGLYLRQIDIPGVDTKFIERNKGLLSELVSAATVTGEDLPNVPGSPNAPDVPGGAAGFEARHGFRVKPPTVRFRLLDPRLAIGGLTDISVPAAQLLRLDIAPARVFVTENEINGLAFPDVPGGVVVFGLGYGVDLLAGARWLEDADLHYWGDIDTHGFAMLDRLRARFPQARSLLMDRATLLDHRALWGREPSPRTGELSRLRDEEHALYDDLRRGRLGPRVRLEQERVRFGRLERALAEVLGRRR